MKKLTVLLFTLVLSVSSVSAELNWLETPSNDEVHSSNTAYLVHHDGGTYLNELFCVATFITNDVLVIGRYCGLRIEENLDSVFVDIGGSRVSIAEIREHDKEFGRDNLPLYYIRLQYPVSSNVIQPVKIPTETVVGNEINNHALGNSFAIETEYNFTINKLPMAITNTLALDELENTLPNARNWDTTPFIATMTERPHSTVYLNTVALDWSPYLVTRSDGMYLIGLSVIQGDYRYFEYDNTDTGDIPASASFISVERIKNPFDDTDTGFCDFPLQNTVSPSGLPCHNTTVTSTTVTNTTINSGGGSFGIFLFPLFILIRLIVRRNIDFSLLNK